MEYKQQIKLLTGEKHTLVGWTEEPSKASTRGNDQPIGPVVPYTRLGTSVETPSAVKARMSQATAIVLLPLWNYVL